MPESSRAPSLLSRRGPAGFACRGGVVWTGLAGRDKQARMAADRTADGATGRGGKATSGSAAPTREDRRKAALKANMARRKDQARLRAAQRQAGTEAESDPQDPDRNG